MSFSDDILNSSALFKEANLFYTKQLHAIFSRLLKFRGLFKDDRAGGLGSTSMPVRRLRV